MKMIVFNALDIHFAKPCPDIRGIMDAWMGDWGKG